MAVLRKTSDSCTPAQSNFISATVEILRPYEIGAQDDTTPSIKWGAEDRVCEG